MNWLKDLKGKVSFNEPLNRYTSFKIGGNASIFFEPKDTEDLIECLRGARKNKVPYFIIGNGTNLLISDRGFKGIFIKLASDFFKSLSTKNNILTVGAGANLSDLIKYLSGTDWTGYEFLAGIPGSVGGALAMNAGAIVDGKRYSIGDIVYRVKVLTKAANILELSKKDIKFGYRTSSLNKYIILQAKLKLNKIEKSEKINRIETFLSYRKKQHDYSKPNAGCIFRNPSQYLSAGALIDRCGLKGASFGGARVSDKHANFILNFNNATANDVVKLIEKIKKEIKNRFDIKLKEEIKIVQ